MNEAHLSPEGSPRSIASGIGQFSFTVTSHDAVNPPSAVVAVTIAEPMETPVTSPVEETVATALLLLDQVILLSVAFAGEKEANSLTEEPTPTLIDVSFK